MKHHLSVRRICLFGLLWLCPFLFLRAEEKERTSDTVSFESLKKQAQESGDPEDWKIVFREAENRRDTAHMGLAYISYIQALANMYPSEDLSQEASKAMAFLFETKQYDYYFALYNIWIDRLFSSKAYQKAQEESAQMYLKAKQLNQSIGMAMALRVQGQIFYKMNLYDKAYAILDEGLHVCEPYQNSLNAFTTAQSLCEWLIMTCLRLEKYEEILPLADRYGEMLDYWTQRGLNDSGGHFTVTSLSLRAIALLKNGRVQEAGDCIKEARAYMRPSFPARAYEHYYEASCLLHAFRGEYVQAISDIDTLLETHRYYYPFYLKDLLDKAELLSLNGQSLQSIALYRDYIHANDSIAKEDIARQLDELRVQHQVEKVHQENLQKTRFLLLACVIILLISLLLLLYVRYARNLNVKNRLLVARLEEYDKRANGVFLPQEKTMGYAEPSDTENANIPSKEIMQRLNGYITNEHLFKNPSLNRDELAKTLQISERFLSNAIKEVNGQTVLEYITMYRLEYARNLLSQENNLTLKEIAELCGFGTLRTFQRLFRDQYGMPPSKYREIIRKGESNNG